MPWFKVLIGGDCADPPLSMTGDPSWEDPSMNVTVPLGVPREEVTVALNVTGALPVDGLSEEVGSEVVVAEFTCNVVEPFVVAA